MAERPYDLLLVGELNVDLIMTGDVAPEFGQVEKLVDDLTVCAGSSAAIMAAGAAKMGLRVLFASVVGDDLFGRFMCDALREAGVDVSHVRRDPTIKTGASVALSRGQDRAILTYPGSIAAVGPEHVDAAWCGRARHLHVVSPFLLTGLYAHLPQMMRAARAAGMTVSLDTNWDPTGRWELEGFFEALDLWLPNEQELLAVTGASDLDAGLAAALERVALVVVKRGARGALAAHATPDGRCITRCEQRAYPVQVVDTTGAGDSFDAGFLAGWLGGEPLARCLALGCACGALTTTQVGGFNGQPVRQEAERLVAEA